VGPDFKNESAFSVSHMENSKINDYDNIGSSRIEDIFVQTRDESFFHTDIHKKSTN